MRTKTFLLLTFSFISSFLFGQKIKTNSKTFSSYYISYPSDPISYKYLEYCTLFDLENCRVKIYDTDDKNLSDISVSGNQYTRIRNSSKENYLPLGNLQRVSVDNAEKTGVLVLKVSIGAIAVKSQSIKNQSVFTASNTTPFINTLQATVPLTVELIDGVTKEVIKKEETSTIWKDNDLADLLSSRDKAKVFLATGYPNITDAKRAAKDFLAALAPEITIDLFDVLIRENRIAGYWKAYNRRYKLEAAPTSTLFLDLFKNDDDAKLAGLNASTKRLKEIADGIEKTAYRDGKIAQAARAEVVSLTNSFLQVYKDETNEDIKSAIETNLLAAYIITDEFEKADEMVTLLKSKKKINTNISAIYSQLQAQALAKKKYEADRKDLSATYSQALAFILN